MSEEMERLARELHLHSGLSMGESAGNVAEDWINLVNLKGYAYHCYIAEAKYILDRDKSLRADLESCRRELEEAKAQKEMVQLGYEAAIESAESRLASAEKENEALRFSLNAGLDESVKIILSQRTQEVESLTAQLREANTNVMGRDSTIQSLAWDIHVLEAQLAEAREEFKNFHRNLCERFNYVHDEKYWWRDLLSLIEWIATQIDTRNRALELAMEHCTCSVKERLSGHLVGCWVPEVEESLRPTESAEFISEPDKPGEITPGFTGFKKKESAERPCEVCEGRCTCAQNAFGPIPTGEEGVPTPKTTWSGTCPEGQEPEKS